MITFDSHHIELANYISSIGGGGGGGSGRGGLTVHAMRQQRPKHVATSSCKLVAVQPVIFKHIN